jgi:hypothetical protein
MVRKALPLEYRVQILQYFCRLKITLCLHITPLLELFIMAGAALGLHS